jgi:hypothetical protein
MAINFDSLKFPDKTEDDSTPPLGPTLDTVIELNNIALSTYSGPNLTKRLAKAVLYKHFKGPDVISDDDTLSTIEIANANGDLLRIEYDTIYPIDLNHNRFKDALITYWLAPAYGSSHCYQPYRAIIIDTDTGYTITNRDFIPDNFLIDSVVPDNGRYTIYGSDYECANNRMLRKIKVSLNYN